MEETNKLDTNGNKHGYWEESYNGVLHSRGNYIHGGQDGYWEYYNDENVIVAKGNCDNGQPIGLWEYDDLYGHYNDKIFYGLD